MKTPFLLIFLFAFAPIHAEEPKVIPDQWVHQGRPVYFTIEINGGVITDSVRASEIISTIQSFLRGNRESRLAVDVNGNVLYLRSMLVPKFFYKDGEKYPPFGDSDQKILVDQWRIHARSQLGKPVAPLIARVTTPKGIAGRARDLRSNPTGPSVPAPLAIAAPRPVVKSRPIKGVSRTEPDHNPPKENSEQKKWSVEKNKREQDRTASDCSSFQIEEKSPGESILSYKGPDTPVVLAEMRDLKTYACSGKSIAVLVTGFHSSSDLQTKSSGRDETEFDGEVPRIVVIETNTLVLVRKSSRLNYEWLEIDRSTGWFRAWYENDRNITLLIAPNGTQIRSALHVEPTEQREPRRRTEP